MTYEPLHHKYRPQTFAQLVGQEAIARTLTNAINSEKIAPAYLFTGPRGTGKTSSARIFAKSLNCLDSEKPTPTPCGKCEACGSISRGSALDVIEIDAASNTGVDNIREIIEKSQFAPVQCRYKVYVIDECHMLSTAAFNALLKTLEEPPNRVIFVLATTDPQRVLPTIISRCQRFDYRRIPINSMIDHLQYIATEENIDITKQSLGLIAQIANGGLRDAESLLDQLSLLSGTIDEEKVWDLVGAVPENDLLELIKAIAANQIDLVLTQCRKLMDRGREPLIVMQNLANFYLNLLIAKNAPHRSDLIAVTENTWQSLCEEAKKWDTNIILQGQKKLKDSEVQIKNTTQPRLWLEVTILSLLPSAITQEMVFVNPPASLNIKQISQTTKTTDNYIQPNPTKIEQISPHTQEKTAIIKETPKESVSQNIPPSEILSTNDSSLDEIWQFILEYVELLTTKALLKQHCTLISFDGLVAIIGIKNKSLFKVASSKKIDIEKAFTKVYQKQIIINLQVSSAENITENLSPQKDKSIETKINPVNPPFESKSNDSKINEQNSLSQKVPENNLKQNNFNPDQNISSFPKKTILDQQQNIDQDEVKQKNQLNKKLEKPHKLSPSAEARKIAENLAKNFAGEIILSEAKDPDEIPF